MFSSNNNAKEFILRSISNSINDRSDISILDFACGTCKIWNIFFKKHSSVNFYGFDFNSESIAKAKNFFPQFNDHIMNLDGQGKLPFDRKFDIITTFSSLEHVYDKKSFINNISNCMNKDGIAYINYDLGHFNKGPIENLYNFITQILANLKLTQRYYTKKVNIDSIISLLKDEGFSVLDVKYFNILSLKKIHKKINSESALNKWYEYELELNTYEDKNFLEKNLMGIVIIAKKNA